MQLSEHWWWQRWIWLTYKPWEWAYKPLVVMPSWIVVKARIIH
jgi:hypothetical protein